MKATQQTISRHDFIDAAPKADKVLVVVFLRGGADGLTLVPPVGDDIYHRARPMLSLKPADVIDLNGYFGLNPILKPLHRYFTDGQMTILHGAGSEDHTRSHFEAQDLMEHGGNRGSGWIGRYLRARSGTASALSAVAIGTTRPESLRGAPAGAVMQTIRDFAFEDSEQIFIEQLGRLYAVDSGAVGQMARDTIDAVKRLRQLRAQADAPGGGAVYPTTTFGRGLREIARLIKADVGLVATTIDVNGWDTHFVQATAIPSRMKELAEGVDAFMTDLSDHRDRVSVVVMTEFGRRVKENTSLGTDHGAGSVMMLLGDGVAQNGLGGTIRSGWPDLSDSSLDEVGDVPAAINYRDVLAPILRRHAPDIDLSRVFPDHPFVPIA